VPPLLESVLEQLSQPRLSVLMVGDVAVRVSSLEREYWPGITKRDYLRYLTLVSPYLLPHLKDRPLTLKRYPTGISQKHFYQKHVEIELPPFVERHALYAEQHQSAGDHVICNNLPTLLWLGQMANLELHPWYSRVTADGDARGLPLTFSRSLADLEASVVNYPDFMVFDLDPYVYSGNERPGDEPQPHREGYQRTCQAALWFKDVLDQLNLPSFVKTSGKTGLHIFVPILRHYDYDVVRGIAEQICRYVLQQHPRELTMEWSVRGRRGKIFLDHNQNTRGKTLVAAYSPRTLVGAPVSMPLEWSELGRAYPTDFTFESTLERLHRLGDLWRDIFGAKTDLAAAWGTARAA
jgi:bifunctional non-homologous end joining protein LigD